ncbi:MAG: transglycosylase SLT domain-containing protein [Rickettsiaceae bacterium]|nr:transglycosylase SLT domain-containing protein [Rickettsiaceae bacterium]
MKKLCSLFITIISILAFSAANASYDEEMETSLRCMKLFKKHEYKYRIPGDTLHSISLNETGKIHSKKKIKIVWPWTANVEGKGYFFETKHEAVQFVRKQILEGKESIDVGCMQVNIKHHPTAFRDLEQAFDPKANIAYAASFLRGKYDELGDWHKAIAHYHSATKHLGEKYKDNVIKTANNIEKYIKPFREMKQVTMNTDSTKVIKKASKNKEHTTTSMVRVKERKYKSNMMVRIPRKQNV